MKKRTTPLIQKLQSKWQLNSLWQVAAVLVAFSLAGSTVVFIRPWFFQWLGMNEQTPWLLKATAYLLFVFPTYQALLLAYGGLLGQYAFFIRKTKKVLQAIIPTQNSH